MNKTLRQPFFTTSDDEWFDGNGGARGPWSVDACHGGPVAGLLARALEAAVADKQLVRLTANFLRPVPMSGFRIEVDIIRDGRQAAAAAAKLVDHEGKTCASATSTHIARNDIGTVATANVRTPPRAGSLPGEFCLSDAAHGQDFFPQHIEMEYPPGEDPAPGATTVWLRAPALLIDEKPSPFQDLCPLADCGNGISRNLELDEMSFVNPDLTIAMHRPPQTEWLASRAVSHWQSNGIGLAHATLFDEIGVVGVALQSLVLRRP